MKRKINNRLIRSFNPCYDPNEVGIDNKESLSVKEWIEKNRKIVKSRADVVWLLCRKEFMSDRNLRLFAVWCAREALKLVESPDIRSINACNVVERFANGQATSEEFAAARDAAWAAAMYAAWDAAWDAAWAARETAGAAARNVDWGAITAERDAQSEVFLWIVSGEFAKWERGM